MDELIAKRNRYAQQVITATDSLFFNKDDTAFDVDAWREQCVKLRI